MGLGFVFNSKNERKIIFTYSLLRSRRNTGRKPYAGRGRRIIQREGPRRRYCSANTDKTNKTKLMKLLLDASSSVVFFCCKQANE